MVGKRIKSRREELGMTQEELAHKLGYKSKSSLSKIEKGKTDIGQSDLPRFAEVLQTTVADLMGWESSEEKDIGEIVTKIADIVEKPSKIGRTLTLEEAELIERYRTLDSDGKDIIEKLIDHEQIRMRQIRKLNNDIDVLAAHHTAKPEPGVDDSPEKDEELMDN